MLSAAPQSAADSILQIALVQLQLQHPPFHAGCIQKITDDPLHPFGSIGNSFQKLLTLLFPIGNSFVIQCINGRHDRC